MRQTKEMDEMAKQLLRDVSELTRAILDGEHDTELDAIQQAVQARRKTMFQAGTRVRLHGTRDATLDGQVGTVIKVNAKRVTVGLGKRDQFGYEREFNVPPSMLEIVDDRREVEDRAEVEAIIGSIDDDGLDG